MVTLSAPESIDGLAAGPDVLQTVSAAKLFLAGNGDGERGRDGAGVLRRERGAQAVEFLTTADHGNRHP